MAHAQSRRIVQFMLAHGEGKMIFYVELNEDYDMRQLYICGFTLLSACLCGAVGASDYTWLASPANNDWLGSVNWDLGAWAAGSGDTATFGSSSESTVNVNGAVAVSALTVNADMSFTNHANAVTLNGPFTVASGVTATYDAGLAQTSTTSSERFNKKGTGTLVLKGDDSTTNTFYRISTHDDGLLVFDGGTHIVYGNPSGPGESEVAGSFAGGRVLVTGGATLAFTNSANYLSNSGSSIVISNGTFDVFSMKEFLNGFGDNNGNIKSRRGSVTIDNGGVLTAKMFRIGKVSVKNTTYLSDDYAVVNVNSGGTIRVSEFTMDDGAGKNYKGTLNFNGGTWDAVSNGSSSGIARMGFGDTSSSGSWSNVTVNIMEGGLYLVHSGVNGTFRKGMSSGAEHDGGVHISGDSRALYWFATNSYNGGTYVGGNVYFCPDRDRSLGAVPSEPQTNLVLESSNAVLHFDKSFAMHPNRDVLIASNVLAHVGTQSSKVGVIQGAIHGGGPNGAYGALSIVSSWNGLTVSDAGERTNKYGRLLVYGRMLHASGTTLLTANTAGSVHENCTLFVKGNASAYDDNRGVLTVTGGVLKAVNNVYTETAQYGQVRVLGGRVEVPREWLNGLSGPGRTTIGGTGEFICPTLRISQSQAKSDGEPLAQVNILTGGVVRLQRFGIDSNTKPCGVVNLDGGTLVARTVTTNFFGTCHPTWTNIFFRVCAGGAVIDSAGKAISINNPLHSAAADDGGLTKKGAGTLTVVNTNGYNGVTCIDGGQLVFSDADGYPGGDLAFTGNAVMGKDTSTPLVTAPAFAFRDGAKVRLVDDGVLSDETYGKPKVVAQATSTPFASLPELVVVDANGDECPPKTWALSLADGGTKLVLAAVRGTTLIVR